MPRGNPARPTTLRLPSGIYGALDSLAAQHGQDTTWAAVYVLGKGLEALGLKPQSGLPSLRRKPRGVHPG